MLKIFSFLTIETEVRNPARFAKIEKYKRTEQVAPQCSRERLAIRDGEVVPDFVVRL